jgi:hypothetical protein
MGRKLLAVLIGVIVAVSFATITIAEEKETARQEHIKKAQEELATLGYYKGEASGKMDKDMKEAVKEFQKKDMDMKIPSGILNEKTRDEIAKKAEKKMKEGKEEGKSPMDKGMEKMEEGKGKMQEGMDKMKSPMDVVK